MQVLIILNSNQPNKFCGQRWTILPWILRSRDEVRKLWVSDGPPNMLLDRRAAVTAKSWCLKAPQHGLQSLEIWQTAHIRTLSHQCLDKCSCRKGNHFASRKQNCNCLTGSRGSHQLKATVTPSLRLPHFQPDPESLGPTFPQESSQSEETLRTNEFWAFREGRWSHPRKLTVHL